MAKKINIRPLGDRVLVEQKQEAEQIKGGIVILVSAVKETAIFPSGRTAILGAT